MRPSKLVSLLLATACSLPSTGCLPFRPRSRGDWPEVRRHILNVSSCPLFVDKHGGGYYTYAIIAGKFPAMWAVSILCNTGDPGDGPHGRVGDAKSCQNGRVLIGARNGTFSQPYRTGVRINGWEGQVYRLNFVFAPGADPDGEMLPIAAVDLRCHNDGRFRRLPPSSPPPRLPWPRHI